MRAPTLTTGGAYAVSEQDENAAACCPESATCDPGGPTAGAVQGGVHQRHASAPSVHSATGEPDGRARHRPTVRRGDAKRERRAPAGAGGARPYGEAERRPAGRTR